jgi:hypothetical protein
MSLLDEICSKVAGSVADQPALVVAGFVDLAIALEAAVLVQMEQHSAKFVRGQSPRKGVGAKSIGFKEGDLAARVLVGGHQLQSRQRI